MPFKNDMLKPGLCKAIKKLKSLYMRSSVCKMLDRARHTVLRLPLYHPDNSTMSFLAKVKEWVTSCNVPCNTEFKTMGKNDWLSLCEHVKNTAHE